MKDGDQLVLAYDIMKHTRAYQPLDRVANRVRMGEVLDSCYCADPKIMFPCVYYTEPKWSDN